MWSNNEALSYSPISSVDIVSVNQSLEEEMCAYLERISGLFDILYQVLNI